MTTFQCQNCKSTFQGGLPTEYDDVGTGDAPVAEPRIDCPYCGAGQDAIVQTS